MKVAPAPITLKKAPFAVVSPSAKPVIGRENRSAPSCTTPLSSSLSVFQEDDDSYLHDVELFHLVKAKNWHRVVRLCKQRQGLSVTPSPANTKRKTLMSPPAALQHSKSSLCSASECDDGPQYMLYLACLHRPSAQTIRSLLDTYPQLATVATQKGGELALHAACEHNATAGVLKELVKDHPGTACHYIKRTAMRALWDARVTTDSDKEEENYNNVFWQKVQILLEAVVRHRFGGEDTAVSQDNDLQCGYILQAAVYLTTLDGPPQIVDYALHKCATQVEIRDPLTRRLPLHVAVGPVSFTRSSFKFAAAAQQQQQQSVIAQLVQVYPEAAGAWDPNEPTGRYPIHTALVNNHTWYGGVRELFENAPESLYYMDVVTGLHAFQLAALPNNGEEADLDTIYCLLRAEPGTLDSSRTSHRKATRDVTKTEPILLQGRLMVVEMNEEAEVAAEEEVALSSASNNPAQPPSSPPTEPRATPITLTVDDVVSVSCDDFTEGQSCSAPIQQQTDVDASLLVCQENITLRLSAPAAPLFSGTTSFKVLLYAMVGLAVWGQLAK